MSNLFKKTMSIVLAFLVVLSCVPIDRVFAETLEDDAEALLSGGSEEFDASKNYLDFDEIVIKNSSDEICDLSNSTFIVGEEYNLGFKVHHLAKLYTLRHVSMRVALNDDVKSNQSLSNLKANADLPINFSFSGLKEGSNELTVTIKGKYIWPWNHYYSRVLILSIDAKEKSSNKFTPTGKDIIVKQGGTAPQAGSFVECSEDGFASAVKSYGFKDSAPSTSTAGQFDVTVIVTYKDDSTDEVNAKLTVEEQFYKVIFKDSQRNLENEKEVSSGGTVSKPDAVTEGDVYKLNSAYYQFLGWFKESENNPFNFNTPIEADMTLNAKWEKKANLFPVKFYFATGKVADNEYFTYSAASFDFYPGSGEGYDGFVYTTAEKPVGELGNSQFSDHHYKIPENLNYSLGAEAVENISNFLEKNALLAQLKSRLKEIESEVTLGGKKFVPKNTDFELELFRIVKFSDRYHIDVKVDVKEGGDNQGGNDQGGNDQGGNDQGGNDQGGNDQGGNDQGGNDQGGNDQGGNDQGGNDQGGNDQGGNDQGGNDQGGNDQGGNDQGGNDQGGNDQGGNDQGGNDQGGNDQGGNDQGGNDQGGNDQGNDDNTTIDLEEESTPLGTPDKSDDKDQNADQDKDQSADADKEETEIINLEEEETPLGTGDGDSDENAETTTEVIDLVEEQVALGGAQLPYTAQHPYLYFTALGGVLVSLGLLLRRAVRK